MKPFLTTIVILVSIIALAGPSAYGQTDSLTRQDSLLSSLRKMDRVESERIGIAGSLSRNYQAAKSLWDASSVQALIKFTDDKSPIVRCYAFLGLIKKKAGQQTIDDILNKHQNDTAKITTMNGCIVWNSSDVITYMKSISAPE